MAVVYVAARIKAGSSVSPFERCNKEIHRPLRHLATGCLLLPHTWPACFFSPPLPPPILPLRLAPSRPSSPSLSVYIESKDPSSCLVSLSSENSGGIKDARTHDVLDRATPSSSGFAPTCARDPLFFVKDYVDGNMMVDFDPFPQPWFRK